MSGFQVGADGCASCQGLEVCQMDPWDLQEVGNLAAPSGSKGNRLEILQVQFPICLIGLDSLWQGVSDLLHTSTPWADGKSKGLIISKPWKTKI